jgi:hypothetical protein
VFVTALMTCASTQAPGKGAERREIFFEADVEREVDEEAGGGVMMV